MEYGNGSPGHAPLTLGGGLCRKGNEASKV
jgi:hypothetical protein